MTCVSSSSSRDLRFACAFAILGLLGSGSGCAMFSRSQTVQFPEREQTQLSQTVFDKSILAASLSEDPEHREMVERVGRQLAQASAQSPIEWQFALVSGSEADLVCLPGGRMIVDEDLLPYCRNEAGLAVAMSHGMAHVIAEHGAERMSHPLVASERQGRLSNPFTRDSKPDAETTFRLAYGMTAGAAEAPPFSQDHNAAADAIALPMMARAGYDPREAPRFWEQFRASDRQNLPKFAEMHPFHEKRLSALDKLLPTALAHYEKSPKHGVGLAIAAPLPSASNNAVALVSHQTASPSKDELVRTAEASGMSSDPFLVGGSEVPPQVAQVVPAEASTFAEPPAAIPSKFAVEIPERVEGDAPPPAPGNSPWAHGRAAQAEVATAADPQPRLRWSEPVRVETHETPRVARPTIDLTDTVPPIVDDNWKSTRDRP